MISNKVVTCDFREGCREYVSSTSEEQVRLEGCQLLVKVSACNISQIHPDVMVDMFSRNPHFCHSPTTCVSGVVVEIGNSVTSVKKNDNVVGILPLDSTKSGCACYCILNDYDTVILPANVDFTHGTAVLSAGVKAYIALQYLGKINSYDVVLLVDAGSSFGSLTVQLAKIWGAKVIAVTMTQDDKFYLENLSHPPDRVIEIDSSSGGLSTAVLKETGKLGANIIIDNGVRLFSNDEDSRAGKDDLLSWKPLKSELISCLAPGGRWITSNPLIQLDPTDSLQLFLLGASISFLFEYSWNLAPTSQGKWIHIAKDLMSKLERELIKPRISKVISLKEFIESGQNLKHTDQIIISVEAS